MKIVKIIPASPRPIERGAVIPKGYEFETYMARASYNRINREMYFDRGISTYAVGHLRAEHAAMANAIGWASRD